MPNRLSAALLLGLLTFTPAAHAAVSPHLTHYPKTPASRSMAFQPLTPEAALANAVMPFVGACVLAVAGLLPATIGQQPLPVHRLLPYLLR